jgi:hypothetical protein
MTLRNPGRLAIHRRSDEIAFLQHRLRVLSDAQISREAGELQDKVLESGARERSAQSSASADEGDLQLEVWPRERDLADELLHTRQTEPLGETLQRRLAMAELVCHDLARRVKQLPAGSTCPTVPAEPRPDGGHAQEEQSGEPKRASRHDRLCKAYWVAEIERRALTEMLNQWWAWLRRS